MPKKITVLDFNDNNRTEEDQTMPQNDAEELTELKNEIKEVEQNEAEVEQNEPEVEQNEPIETEVKPEVKPKRGTKPEDLVTCSRCGKSMSRDNLKYKHDRVCGSLRVKKEKEEIIIAHQKSNEPPITKKAAPQYSIPEEILQEEVNKRLATIRENRILKRHQNLQKLVENIA
jgi:hypothetical protein